MPVKIFGKQIGTVVRAQRSPGKSTPKQVGKNKFNTLADRGAKQVRRGGNHKTATPKAFGGPNITAYPNASQRKGGGANKGGGDTTGFDI